ncbi:MAG: DUF2249 domain-containing protein [bacterium]|nr:DUF2249 domain-containing protein [bacterium]
MAKERVLDVSEYEAPEPFRLAVEAVNQLEEGECLRMCHRRQPFPLYETLAELGFSYRVMDGTHTRYEILIWRADDPALTAHCGPAAEHRSGTKGTKRGCR